MTRGVNGSVASKTTTADARVFPCHHHRIVVGGTVGFLRYDDRFDAFAIEIRTGEPGSAELGRFELPGRDTLHHAGIVGSRELFHRHAQLLLRLAVGMARPSPATATIAILAIVQRNIGNLRVWGYYRAMTGMAETGRLVDVMRSSNTPASP